MRAAAAAAMRAAAAAAMRAAAAAAKAKQAAKREAAAAMRAAAAAAAKAKQAAKREAAAAKRAAVAAPLSSEEAQQQAQAEALQQAQVERLTLCVADTTTGYLGVHLDAPGKPKPYRARVKRDGKNVTLGAFASAEEAALCVARSPEGQEAAERAAAAPPLTSEEALQQAQVEGLTLRAANTTTGYVGVHLGAPGKPKPYLARVRRDGKNVTLGAFASAEEAALCVARSPPAI
jgi:NADH:ubiquinone oxidoreductase subunit D